MGDIDVELEDAITYLDNMLEINAGEEDDSLIQDAQDDDSENVEFVADESVEAELDDAIAELSKELENMENFDGAEDEDDEEDEEGLENDDGEDDEDEEGLENDDGEDDEDE